MRLALSRPVALAAPAPNGTGSADPASSSGHRLPVICLRE